MTQQQLSRCYLNRLVLYSSLLNPITPNLARSGAGDSRQSDDFALLTAFVQEPAGCRHGCLVAEFDGEPGTRGSTADRLGPCVGGCDVCSLRLDALRDLTAPARVALHALSATPQRQPIDDLIAACLSRGHAMGALPAASRGLMWSEQRSTIMLPH